MKIALIDSHQIVTEALKVNLLKSITGLRSVNSYSSIEAFVARKPEEQASIIITELCFNGRYDKGVDLIFSSDPHVKVIILTSISDDHLIRSYMKLGAKAYLTKTCLFQELIDAITQVQKGNLFLSQDIQDVLWAGITSGGPSTDNLSSIERAILEGLSRDEPFRTIADNLNISMIELKYHRKMLMDRFNLKHFANLVEFAKKPGVLNAGTSQSYVAREQEKRKPGIQTKRRKLAMSVY